MEANAEQNGRDFAYVAGTAPVVKPKGLRDGATSNDVVMEAIAVLMDWRRVRSFECNADLNYFGTVESYRVIAQPMVSSYVCTNTRSGIIDSYDATRGSFVVGGQPQALSAMRVSPEPPALQLIFPMSMQVWGRPHDAYQISGGRVAADMITLDLSKPDSDEVHGSLVIDTQRRMAVRLETPTVSCYYRDIEPHYGRF